MERGGDAENYIVALVWGDVTGGGGWGGALIGEVTSGFWKSLLLLTQIRRCTFLRCG